MSKRTQLINIYEELGRLNPPRLEQGILNGVMRNLARLIDEEPVEHITPPRRSITVQSRSVGYSVGTSVTSTTSSTKTPRLRLAPPSTIENANDRVTSWLHDIPDFGEDNLDVLAAMAATALPELIPTAAPLPQLDSTTSSAQSPRDFGEDLNLDVLLGMAATALPKLIPAASPALPLFAPAAASALPLLAPTADEPPPKRKWISDNSSSCILIEPSISPLSVDGSSCVFMGPWPMAPPSNTTPSSLPSDTPPISEVSDWQWQVRREDESNSTPSIRGYCLPSDTPPISEDTLYPISEDTSYPISEVSSNRQV